MFQAPGDREHLSLMLSQVLDDIGVNKRMVMRTRRVHMMLQNVCSINERSFGDGNLTTYYFGSQSEGTTTPGLDSDIDILLCNNCCNVIQDSSECEPGAFNYLMIQDKNTTPGYCFLQLLRPDNRPATAILGNNHITDRKGRILHKNTHRSFENVTRNGPSIFMPGQQGFCDRDNVLAYRCKSWPKSACGWLERKSIGKWPTQEIKKLAASTGCFVVRTGSKVSEYPELEWRISTSRAEKCLTFSLTKCFTQIRCYVLLKMICKEKLNPQGNINLSSFMCKTVLFHCIETTESTLWQDKNLLKCLTLCLDKLSSCVQNDNLSHFIIPENNLMAGQFTAETKCQLLINISDFIQNDVQSLLRINIDYLGQRLQVKLKRVPQIKFHFPSSLEISEDLSYTLYINFARQLSRNQAFILNNLNKKGIKRLEQCVHKLINCSKNDHILEHTAYNFLAPFLFATYGSALASASKCLYNKISPKALIWLLDGLVSDVTSSRLKLASVFYSKRDMEKAEKILGHTEQQYNIYSVLPICNCFELEKCPKNVSTELIKVCNEQSLDCIKNITAFCVRYIQEEIKCVPHELQYEMFRSTKDDMIHRGRCDFWMDWVVVDSLPFLYFLRYKIYSHLNRYQDQQQALSQLLRAINTDENLTHKETALNLLGQCMEQENRPHQALKCYLRSLRRRTRNNVAKIHICRLISRLVVAK